MTNILSFMRANTPDYALNTAISGGKIPVGKMLALYGGDEEAQECALDKCYLADFWRECLKLRREGKPFSEPERRAASVEIEALYKNRFELKRGQPFLYYVLRRRADNLNVRILLSCLLAGMPEGEIVKKLRGAL